MAAKTASTATTTTTASTTDSEEAEDSHERHSEYDFNGSEKREENDSTDDDTGPGNRFSSGSSDVSRQRHRSTGCRRISVGTIIVATIAMVFRAQSDTNFKKRPVYAKLTEVNVPSGSEASESYAYTGRLQKTSGASPVARLGMTIVARIADRPRKTK